MKRSTAIPGSVGLALVLCAAVLMAACGGGGDSAPAATAAAGGGQGGTASGQAASADANAQDAAASQAFNASYFPLAPVGANWLFDVRDKGGTQLGRDQIAIGSSDGSHALLQQNDRGSVSQENYSVDANGVYLNRSWGQGNASMALNPQLYSFAGYTVGATRSASGSAYADIDGDGLVDRASYQLTQVLVGYDDDADLPIKGGVAHFKNVLTLAVNQGKDVVTGETRSEDIWLAPGIGPVQMTRSTTDLLRGQTTFARYRLVAAQVGNSRFPAS